MKKDRASYQFFPTVAEAWEAMYSAIESAQKSVYWELYIFNNDEVGERFRRLLEEKARQGLEIKLIFDGFGSFWFNGRAIWDLRRAGAEVLYFNPLKISYLWRGLRRWFERTHRKVLIVDEKTGFIGGVNVHKSNFGWLDLQVMVEGEIVRSLLKSFARSYLAGGGKLARVRHIFYLPVTKERYWRVLWHKPQSKISSVRRVYLQAINRAKKTLVVVSPYFLPDKEFLEALRRARRRGVKIDLILPWKTDHWFMTYAMRAYWRPFSRLGMKVRLIKKMIHAKAMMVDGRWAMVGSSNFDPQTFYRSHETNLIFTNKSMLGDLKKIFQGWKKKTRLFHPRSWSKRSVFSRFYEVLCRLLRPIL